MKIKRIERICQYNTKYKEAEMTILTSEKVDFRTKNTTENKRIIS